MSTNSEGGQAHSRDEATVLDVLSPTGWDWGSVLVEGPAMAGKQALAVTLLTTARQAGGQPLAVTTADTADQLRTAYHDAGGEATDNLAVVNCLLGSDEIDDDWTRTVGSPGDFTGIAMAVSEVFDGISPQRRAGARVLVDNLATSLLYSDLEPTYRFVHALVGRVTDSDGVVIATLDTDGIETATHRALVGLFDTVIEVRQTDGAAEFRVTGAPDVTDEWHRVPNGGVGA